jgi:hypothetical protein
VRITNIGEAATGNTTAATDTGFPFGLEITKAGAAATE